MANTISSTQATSAAYSGGSAASGTSEVSDSDRFMTLLVAQLQNQDPMNPMDNAQMTSQMAQINTVSGIHEVNQSVQDLSTLVSQYQGLQGLNLVGHEVLVPGSRADIDANGRARGAFSLTGAADHVKVEVTTAGGQVTGSMDLGVLTAGQHSFQVDSSQLGSDLRFRVTATQGGQAVTTQTFSYDQVTALQADTSQGVQLDLRYAGTTAYQQLQSIQ